MDRFTLGVYSDICLLALALTLWTVVHSFTESLQMTSHCIPCNDTNMAVEHGKPSWEFVYRRYKLVRKYCEIINEALSHLVTGFMAEATIFYSVNLDMTVVTENNWKKSCLIYFYCCTFSILLYSANICTKMGSLKIWLADDGNRRTVPLDELQIVLGEIQANDVGIKISKVFTITYSLIANVSLSFT